MHYKGNVLGRISFSRRNNHRRGNVGFTCIDKFNRFLSFYRHLFIMLAYLWRVPDCCF